MYITLAKNWLIKLMRLNRMYSIRFLKLKLCWKFFKILVLWLKIVSTVRPANLEFAEKCWEHGELLEMSTFCAGSKVSTCDFFNKVLMESDGCSTILLCNLFLNNYFLKKQEENIRKKVDNQSINLFHKFN